MINIHFEQFELDDLRVALEQMEDDETRSYTTGNTTLDFQWFLERVVEVADRNRARAARKSEISLDNNLGREHTRPRS